MLFSGEPEATVLALAVACGSPLNGGQEYQELARTGAIS